MALKKLSLVVVGFIMVLVSCPNSNDSGKNDKDSFPVIYTVGYESNGTNNVLKIWKSTDDGKTWTSTAITDGTHRAATIGSVLKGSALYVLGHEYNDVDNNYTYNVWNNANSGGIWTAIPFNNPQWLSNLTFFTDGSALYVSGFLSGSGGALFKSIDDGANWTAIPFDTGGGDTGTADGSTLYVVGSIERNTTGGVLKSTDGGVNWTPLVNLENYTQSFPGGIFVDGSRIYITGSDYNAPGGSSYARVWISTDGGTSWSTNVLPGTLRAFVSNIVSHGSTIYVSGYVEDNDNNLFVKTWISTDSGGTWAETSLSGYVTAFTVHGSMVYAIGAEFNGNNLEGAKLWKTTNDGAIWTEYAITDGTHDAMVNSIIIGE